MEAVCDATGAAESYRVSVSWVGSDCSRQVRDSVPAPQSQKNLQHKPHRYFGTSAAFTFCLKVTSRLYGSWSASARSYRILMYQRGKTNLDLLKQETVSGSGISWATCKSAPRSRQITMPAPHRLPFLLPNQQRQSTEGKVTTQPQQISYINISTGSWSADSSWLTSSFVRQEVNCPRRGSLGSSPCCSSSPWIMLLLFLIHTASLMKVKSQISDRNVDVRNLFWLCCSN